jgi:hypothetical protein
MGRSAPAKPGCNLRNSNFSEASDLLASNCAVAVEFELLQSVCERLARVCPNAPTVKETT